MRRPAVLLTLITPLALSLSAPAQSSGQRFLGQPASAWAKELKSPSPATRRTAAFALGKIGAEGRPHVAELVAIMADADESVREAAANALGEIGPMAAPDAVRPLTRQLESDTAPAVRRAAAAALGKIGSQAASASAALKAALAHKDARVRQNAAWALGQIGASAIEGAVPDLRKLLKDADPMVRRDTALALGNGGNVARDAVHDLIAALSDQDILVRRYAVTALGKLGTAAEPAVPVLVSILDDRTAGTELQREALLALCHLGGGGTPEALPALRRALRDEDPLMREVAAGALVNMGDAAMPALPDLAPLLQDKEFRVRRNATLAIDRLLPKADATVARRVVPGLLHILEHEKNGDLRVYATWCFLQIPVNLKEREFGHAKEVLIKVALTDDNFNVRCEAARAAVFNFGAEAKAVTPTLIENLKQKTRIIEGTSTKSEGGGEDKTGSTSVETKGTRDGRVLPAQALGLLGKAAGPEAKKALEEAAQDPGSAELREAAKKALMNF